MKLGFQTEKHIQSTAQVNTKFIVQCTDKGPSLVSLRSLTVTTCPSKREFYAIKLLCSLTW